MKERLTQRCFSGIATFDLGPGTGVFTKGRKISPSPLIGFAATAAAVGIARNILQLGIDSFYKAYPKTTSGREALWIVLQLGPSLTVAK